MKRKVQIVGFNAEKPVNEIRNKQAMSNEGVFLTAFSVLGLFALLIIQSM
jgi:hypothetical protein